MDAAIITAYGWNDLLSQLHCEFLLDYEEEEAPDSIEKSTKRQRKKPWRYRWPDDLHDEVLARLLKLNAERAEEERINGETATKTQVKRRKRVIVDTPSPMPLFQPVDEANRPSPALDTWRDFVACLHFEIPQGRRYNPANAAQHFLTLIPALIQEAGGVLPYDSLIAALSYLFLPEAKPEIVPDKWARSFVSWKANFPKHLIQPGVLAASLEYQIVQTQMLNIRPEADGYTMYKGKQFQPITLPWTLLDARIALAAAAEQASAVITPPQVLPIEQPIQTTGSQWTNLVPNETLQRWTRLAA